MMNTENFYRQRHVGLDDGKLEKLWNVENSGESYYWNDVEFPYADFMTELERKYKSYNAMWEFQF